MVIPLELDRTATRREEEVLVYCAGSSIHTEWKGPHEDAARTSWESQMKRRGRDGRSHSQRQAPAGMVGTWPALFDRCLLAKGRQATMDALLRRRARGEAVPVYPVARHLTPTPPRRSHRPSPSPQTPLRHVGGHRLYAPRQRARRRAHHRPHPLSTHARHRAGRGQGAPVPDLRARRVVPYVWWLYRPKYERGLKRRRYNILRQTRNRGSRRSRTYLRCRLLHPTTRSPSSRRGRWTRRTTVELPSSMSSDCRPARQD